MARPSGRSPFRDGRLYAGGNRVVAVTQLGRVAWRDDDSGDWPVHALDGETLYAWAGRAGDRATVYDTASAERWTFAPSADSAWPAATEDALAATAITGETSTEPFCTVYVVDADGPVRDTVFDALGHGGRLHVADGTSAVLAVDPTG